MQSQQPPKEKSWTLLRGIPLPSKISSNPEKYPTRAACEIAKSTRKRGNLGRSVSLAGNMPPFSPVGFIIFNPDMRKFISISPLDEDTGYAEKESYLFTKRLSPEKAEEELKKLQQQTINSVQKRLHESRNMFSAHSEIIYDISQNDFAGIYYYGGKNFYDRDKEIYTNFSPIIGERFGMTLSSLQVVLRFEFGYRRAELQAIFLQQEYKRLCGKTLPIYHYDPIFKYRGVLREKKGGSCDEAIMGLWEDIIYFYLHHVVEKDELLELLATMSSIEDVKMEAVYDNISEQCLPLDIYYDEELKSRINNSLVDMLKTARKMYVSSLLIDLYSEKYEDEKQLLNDDINEEILKYNDDLEVMCEWYLLFYLDEIFSSKNRADVLEKLLKFLLFIWYEVDDETIAFKAISSLMTMNDFVKHDELVRLIEEDFQQEPFNCRQIIRIDSLMRHLSAEHQQQLLPALKISAGLIINACSQDGVLPDTYSDEDLGFLNILKKMDCPPEKISDYAIALFVRERLDEAGMFKLTEYIDFDSEFFNQEDDEVPEDNNLRTIVSELIKAKKTESLEIDKNIKNTSRYFFSRATDIPWLKLRKLMIFYSREQHEVLPERPFKLLMIAGMRILLRNRAYYECYLKKISNVMLPKNVMPVLDALLEKTLDYYPDALEDPDICWLLTRLHAEFEWVLCDREKAVVSLPFAAAEVLSNITPLAQQALIYANKHHLSNQYQNENGETQFPVLYYNHRNEVSVSSAKFYRGYIQGGNDTGMVYRSNHGLVHVSCTLYYVRSVLAFYCQYGAFDIVQPYLLAVTHDESEKFISKIQIAMCFYVTGREGEQGFECSAYEEYRQNSAENFVRFVNESDEAKMLFNDSDEIEAYKQALKSPYIEDDMDSLRWSPSLMGSTRKAFIRNIVLKIILHACHNANLVRIWGPEKIHDEALKNFMKGVDNDDAENHEIKHAALLIFKMAAKLNRLMGNSVMTDYDAINRKCIRPKIKYSDLYETRFPKTDVETFMHYSNSPEACILLLNSLTKEELLRDEVRYSPVMAAGLFAKQENRLNKADEALFSIPTI